MDLVGIKKVQTIAPQQSETKRVQNMSEISVFDSDMLIWIDKTGYRSE